jgi:hypothetical protein
VYCAGKVETAAEDDNDSDFDPKTFEDLDRFFD